ncbi:nucleoside-diphosphate kinase [Thermoplasmatales archaeon ex4484_30]|nr:MAG: nucleoside-diphosphate kinase [Thermoplasmata archaeon]OYT60494.1 MAG: nucleoside-diphosphate kinase [Thermoplasmatales archaeon ex4484_30]
MERTFLMIKPDGVQRRLIGKILQRIEQSGFKIVAMKFLKVSQEMAEKHYEMHKGKPFYEGLIKYITSGPVLAMIVEGENAIERIRRLVGSTDPQKAEPGTIRGDFAQHIGRNIIHASDGKETAEKEINLWFKKEEIVEYGMQDDRWIYES